MWFESLLVFIVFKFKENHNIYGIRVVHKTIIWSPADFVRLPTDKEMISL